MASRNRTRLAWLSFFIELPFDVRLPDDSSTNVIDFHSGPFLGWEDVSLQEALGHERLPENGIWPTTTLRFRRAVLPASPPLTRVRATYAGEIADRTRWRNRILNRIRRDDDN